VANADSVGQPIFEGGVESSRRQPEIERGIDQRLHVRGPVDLARHRDRAVAGDERLGRVVAARIFAHQVENQPPELRLVGVDRKVVEAGKLRHARWASLIFVSLLWR
jgi:hypothetical protein